MRVSTGRATQSDSRMFTVVVEAFGVGKQRQAERRFTVPLAQLQGLMQTIARQGGRISAVLSGEASPPETSPQHQLLPRQPLPPNLLPCPTPTFPSTSTSRRPPSWAPSSRTTAWWAKAPSAG